MTIDDIEFFWCTHQQMQYGSALTMPTGDPLSRHFLIPTRNATKKVTVNQGALKKSGGQDMPIFKDSHKSTYLPLSRPQWFRFNESAHVMVKQKTLATDLSRGLGLVKSSFRSNPSVLVKSGQIRAVSGQIRAVFFLGIVAQIYLPTCMFLRNFVS